MKFIHFHLIDEPNGYMSNWFMRDFTVDGVKYNCVEQYMMKQKALLFGDTAIAAQIMQTSDQQEMQDLGKLVKNFDSAVWDGTKQLIVYKGVYEKFRQNPDLAAMLIATGDAIPIECARRDHVWGIGLGMHNPDADDISKWNGKNLLGFTLRAVRDEIKKI